MCWHHVPMILPKYPHFSMLHRPSSPPLLDRSMLVSCLTIPHPNLDPHSVTLLTSSLHRESVHISRFLFSICLPYPRSSSTSISGHLYWNLNNRFSPNCSPPSLFSSLILLHAIGQRTFFTIFLMRGLTLSSFNRKGKTSNHFTTFVWLCSCFRLHALRLLSGFGY